MNIETGTPGGQIVLISYAISPHMGSEPGVGWQFLMAAVKLATRTGRHLHVVCNTRSADNLAAGLTNYPNLTVHSVEAKVAARLKVHTERLKYLEWIRASRKVVNDLLREHDSIAIVHQVTFASEILPVALPLRCAPGVVRIWGPVGSAGEAKAFTVGPQSATLRLARASQILRDYCASRLGRRNLKRADVVLLQSGSVARLSGPNSELDVRVFPNFVPPESYMSGSFPARGGDNLQLICIGQLITLKRVDLAIRALADENLATATLTIVGAGPQLGYLKRLCHNLGLTDRVTFVGEVSREDAARLLADADVLVHLSAREGASGVVAEAGMLGVPVACFDGTGAATTLRYGQGAGVFIRFLPQKPLVSDIAKAILTAANLVMPPTRVWDPQRLDGLLSRIYDPVQINT